MAYDPKYRRMLHAMEYYRYLDGLIRRYSKQEGRWDAHLASCRKYILDSIDQMKPGTVTILGSGWLLDVPLAEMSSRVKQIYLVDIIQPPDVAEQTRAFPNVKLLEEDITGGVLRMIWDNRGKTRFFAGKAPFQLPEIPQYSFPFNPGMVISLNVMSQLAALPERFLLKRKIAGKQQVNELKRRLQYAHLQMLMSHSSVLITDVAEIISGNKGIISEEPTVVIDLPESGSTEKWDWDFDLGNLDYNTMRSVLKVVAMRTGNDIR